MNLRNDRVLKFTPIATGTFNVAAGAAGWVDTDVSATTGIDVTKLWIINCTATTYGTQGVRPNGSAVDNSIPGAARTNTILSYVSATGHLDLYRDAIANNSYHLIGYLK